MLYQKLKKKKKKKKQRKKEAGWERNMRKSGKDEGMKGENKSMSLELFPQYTKNLLQIKTN